jgi:1-acyl-sn-glycerol-3-phosphate acyltransferase
MPQPLYTIPIADRPPGHGRLWSKIVFPLVFNLGILGINSAQFLCLLLLLLPGGRQLYKRAIDWTKDGFGRLLIAITVLCAPTSLTITTNAPPELSGLVGPDGTINLPPRLVLMANHQAYTDWMYLWILACYAGHARGLTILLKASLKHIPVVGWGMQFFRFVFMHRSWAADREHLTRSLTRLGKQAAAGTPLWLLIFPEGTIVSDNERAKSAKYAARESIRDLHGVLHPRSTGLLFALRTLLPSIPDLQLLDITIAYPGVPFGKYPQEWYGLGSVFFQGVPPPTVRLHLHMYSVEEIPSLPKPPYNSAEITPLATTEEAREFELWLRNVWTQKEARLERMLRDDIDEKMPSVEVPVEQRTARDWVATFGAGGMMTVAAAAGLIRYFL